ncbi:MAG TPA: hypothetical protein VIC33_11750, partial [Vicinamibacterales bacterium]
MTVQEMLREADPIRHECAREEQRVEIRRRVLAATDGARARQRSRWASSRVAALAAAVILVTIALLGSRAWFGGDATLLAAVRFEVRLAETTPAPGFQQVKAGDGFLYLHPTPVVTNGDVVSASVMPRGTTYEIDVVFTAAGAARMRQAMAAHLGAPMAILIDGQLVAAPVVRSAIKGDEALISGKFTKAQ